MQQHRGHAAALFILGFAVLGILAVSAVNGVPRQASAAGVPFSFSGMPDTAPAADSADDEETDRATRLLQHRADSAGGAVGSSGLADFVFWLSLAAAAALVAPFGRTTVSLGPRAPPRALNLKLRRLAWQA
jgi:hypothetical protein